MNKTKLILLAVCALFATSVFSQELKFGHINLQELIVLMPDKDSADVKLRIYSTNLEETLTGMQNEYQNKVSEYQQKNAAWTAVVLESKQNEIQSIEQRIMEFQKNAQEEYQGMQQLVYAPVFAKAQETVNKLGKEQGLIYIFDTSSGTIPYVDDSKSVNLMSLAKTALGIPADKALPMGQQQPQ